MTTGGADLEFVRTVLNPPAPRPDKGAVCVELLDALFRAAVEYVDVTRLGTGTCAGFIYGKSRGRSRTDRPPPFFTEMAGEAEARAGPSRRGPGAAREREHEHNHTAAANAHVLDALAWRFLT